MLTLLNKREVAPSPLATTRKAIALILAVILGAILTACSTGDEKTAETQEAPKPQRIVALDWRYEEILVGLGITPVGIVEIGKSTAPSTLDGKLEGATSVGQAKQPNLETIQSLEPDLILASPTRHAAIMDQLKEIAPTDSYSDASYTDVLEATDSIAEKLGKQAEAHKLRENITQKIKEAKNTITPGERSALIGWAKGNLYTWVDMSFPASLLKDVGYTYGYTGEKSAIESKTDVAELTGDKLPDMKLDTMYLYNDTEGFRQTPYAEAVGKIIDVDQDVWSRSRGPLAAEAILDQIIATGK